MFQNRNQNSPPRLVKGLVILQSLQRYRPRISDATIITKIGINLNKQTHNSHDGYSVLGNPGCLDYNIIEHRNKLQIAVVCIY